MRLFNKKKYSIEIRGNKCLWSFTIPATESDAEDWRKDGLNVSLVVATIPKWVVDIGLCRPYLLMIRASRWTFNTLLGRSND